MPPHPQPHRPGYVSERVCSRVKGHSSRRLTAFRIIAGHRGTRHWYLDYDAREPMCFFQLFTILTLVSAQSLFKRIDFERTDCQISENRLKYLS